ncbi:MAG: TatD family hydrolase [Armatimonadota bacterium]
MIDTHAHLNDPKFASDLDEVVSRAKVAGVDRIVVCGYDLPSSRNAVEIASRFDGVFATVGVHPHDAKTLSRAGLEELRELARAPKVIAIGETGLDFHYDFSPRDMQIEAFAAQVELAQEIGLPIVVHSRESSEETFEVVASASPAAGCVFHCFSGDEDFARRVVESGFYIGIDGPITFQTRSRNGGDMGPAASAPRQGGKLRRVVETTPLDHLVLETDCPYLAPVPHRGKRNEPAYLVYVAEEVARIKGICVEELDRVTSENARRLFDRLD